MMTGRGGWPMSVFLTPDSSRSTAAPIGRPDRDGHARLRPGADGRAQTPGDNRRDEVRRTGRPLTEQLRQSTGHARTGPGPLDVELAHQAARALERNSIPATADSAARRNFPIRWTCGCCCDVRRREAATAAARWSRSRSTKWPRGGIYDQLGGGFHRYSVDAAGWCRISRKCSTTMPCWPRLRRSLSGDRRRRLRPRARETLDYVLREMTDPGGGFYSTQDADSEGEEGKFYLWTPAEIEQRSAPQRAATFCYAYDVTEAGNFEEAAPFSTAPRPSCSAPRCSAVTPEELPRELAESRRRRIAGGRETARRVQGSTTKCSSVGTA